MCAASTRATRTASGRFAGSSEQILRFARNCLDSFSVERGGGRRTSTIVAPHRVENREEFSHTGHERDFFRFPVGEESTPTSAATCRCDNMPSSGSSASSVCEVTSPGSRTICSSTHSRRGRAAPFRPPRRPTRIDSFLKILECIDRSSFARTVLYHILRSRGLLTSESSADEVSS